MTPDGLSGGGSAGRNNQVILIFELDKFFESLNQIFWFGRIFGTFLNFESFNSWLFGSNSFMNKIGLEHVIFSNDVYYPQYYEFI